MGKIYKIGVLGLVSSLLLAGCATKEIKTSEQAMAALSSTGYLYDCSSKYEGEVTCSGSKDYDGNEVSMHVFKSKAGLEEYICEVLSNLPVSDYQFLLSNNWALSAYGPDYGNADAQKFIYEKLQEKIGGTMITNDPWSELCI